MTRGKVLGALAAVAVLAAAAVCVRLGFWQLARLEAKHTLNATSAASLSAPPVEWPAAGTGDAAVIGRRVRVRGTYDETRQILLRGRMHEGEPGVGVVTPLQTLTGEWVLIERGWLPAEDALTARPQEYPEPGPVEVEGMARALETQGRAPYRLPGDGPQVFSAARLNRDSLTRVFPYPVAGFFIHQHAGPGVPALPKRTLEAPLNEGLHLGYAVQWFAIAVILVAGSTWFAWTRWGRGSARNRPPNT